MDTKYSSYFNIDPNYFPQVTPEVMKIDPDLWKKYYPHKTFVSLLKNTVSVLKRSEKKSIWVEGSYGTGKSHAVLTLKHLLDCPQTDLDEYFTRYKDLLPQDLCSEFKSLKSSGKILTVHRYGSSNIRGDMQLAFAIQRAISDTLKENGIENKASGALVDSFADWLKNENNRAYFNNLVTSEYRDLFCGDDLNAILNKLTNNMPEAVEMLMAKVLTVAEEKQMSFLQLDAEKLNNWITEVIKANNLRAIVFIWDEFSEFFENNATSLTGFQSIVELNNKEPFYLVIVTHQATSFFDGNNREHRKIFDRFLEPRCHIDLPENMAFKLMGAAMEKTDDSATQNEWKDVVEQLYTITSKSRAVVKKHANISENDLAGILPIHPYAALLLKYIATAFQSNQRSMFDFIKNDRGDEIRGFQWYIKNYGPYDSGRLLTVDLLWDFFYEKGKDNLAPEIRAILDCYNRTATLRLDPLKQRVLKAVLLLQAISQNVGGSVELFIPNADNLNNAFEGSEISDRAAWYARQLVNDRILFSHPVDGVDVFETIVNTGDRAEIEKEKELIRKEPTSTLIPEISDAVKFEGALGLRYKLSYAAQSDFDSRTRTARQNADNNPDNIQLIVAFSRTEAERSAIAIRIGNALAQGNCPVVFAAASTIMDSSIYERYIEEKANAKYQSGKNNNVAAQREAGAKKELEKWRNSIKNGEFIVYWQKNMQGKRAVGFDDLCTTLKEINRDKYPDCLEGEYNVIANMYNATPLPKGVECGARQEVSGTYRSSTQSTKLETALAGAWQVENYWQQPQSQGLLIARIKRDVDIFIEERFERDGRVSVSDIYDHLREAPYGFMPCNLSAFMMGFLLKEYVDCGYNWSDTLTSDKFGLDKLKDSVSEVISQQISPNNRFRPSYIVKTTPEEKAFYNATTTAFAISGSCCVSIENARESVRNQIKNMSFPIWSLKFLPQVAGDEDVKTLLDRYCELANNKNATGLKTDSDIANEIGKLAMQHPDSVERLKSLLNKDNCTLGMTEYVAQYKEGELKKLAGEIADMGQYINVLRSKFDADAANWVWNVDTAQERIDKTITEYKIIRESNKLLTPKCNSFEKTIEGWADLCRNIKISYDAAKNSFGEITPLMEMLIQICRTEQISDSEKAKFLEMLEKHLDGFNRFYGAQESLFAMVCKHIFANFNLSDADIKEIFAKLDGMFTAESMAYMNHVRVVANSYVANLASTKLKRLWREKTNTDSPRKWSDRHRMPVLLMVPPAEIQEAKKAFGIINGDGNNNRVIVEDAIEYIEKAAFFDDMKNTEAQDAAFAKFAIGDYAPLLGNIDDVKTLLENKIPAPSPYDWMDFSTKVNDEVKAFAQREYAQNGADAALKKIDSLSEAEVKKYLKQLIRDNMNVGVEILKNR